MSRNLSFAVGMGLVLLGAIDLYAGLSQTGMGEAAFVAIAQSFMLLFPGYVFFAYSLQRTPRMTSLSRAEAPEQDMPVEIAMPVATSDNVVVVFPARGGKSAGGRPGFKAQSK